MNKGKKEYTFLWFIENYSYCWHKNGEVLTSPDFTADSLEGTDWSIELYPRGFRDEDKGNISIFLSRSQVDTGPEQFPIKYELSVLRKDGSVLYSADGERIAKRGEGYGFPKIMETDDIFLRETTDHLIQDTLSIRCKIWKEEGEIQPVVQISAKSVIEIEKISFLHVVRGFSVFKPNERETIQITSPSKEGNNLSSTLYISDDSWCEEKIIVEITPSHPDQILSKCELSLLQGSGKAIKCGEADNRFHALRKDIQKLALSLTRLDILNRRDEYLPDDKLTLMCECTFSTGGVYEKIESSLHEIPFAALNKINDSDQDKDAEEMSACSSVTDDLKTVYNNQFSTDVELKTKTKSFPVHKIVLCARSPIFKAMLSNDMKEKKCNLIQIDDLEDDIVEQFLLFLYSDDLGNLQWDSAVKLYYAGDKYDVKKLKVMCVSFLLENLNTNNASELLLLADTHSDSEIRQVVEDFIFKHEEEIFGSDEWGNLMVTNPLLVSSTMCLKYVRKIK